MPIFSCFVPEDGGVDLQFLTRSGRSHAASRCSCRSGRTSPWAGPEQPSRLGSSLPPQKEREKRLGSPLQQKKFVGRQVRQWLGGKFLPSRSFFSRPGLVIDGLFGTSRVDFFCV